MTEDYTIKCSHTYILISYNIPFIIHSNLIYQLIRTTFWTRHAALPPREEQQQSVRNGAEGFTNIAATADDNKTEVFTVEENKGVRDRSMDIEPHRRHKGKTIKTSKGLG